MTRSLSSCDQGISLAKSALIGKCLSRQKLADQVGVHKQTIDKFFRGGKIENIIFVKICQELDLDWEEISSSRNLNDQNISLNLEIEKETKDRQNSKPITYQDLLEQELNVTALKDLDLQLAVNLCNSILITFNQVLYTFYQSENSLLYDEVPPVRVLLFLAYPQLNCLSLQLYVTRTEFVINCKHRFTLDSSKQKTLSLVARSWNSQNVQSLTYSHEFLENKDEYLRQSIEFGFDSEKIAHIVTHIASAIAFPFQKCKFRHSGMTIPIVICVDSEKKYVFPNAIVNILNKLLSDMILEFNTGKLSPLELQIKDFRSDNRGMIDECLS